MINITDSKFCSGCTSCACICPKSCIAMVSDKEGFLYPKIDSANCVNCGLCEKTCPIQNQLKITDQTKTYACQNKDTQVRNNSTSGGIFSLLAEHVLSMGGVVFGAGFDENLHVIHKYVEQSIDLAELRGSKYVQSKLDESFKQVKNFLTQGRRVLFVGTPCQAAGLIAFLKSDYENLLVADLACYGVPSPKLYNEWIAYLEKKYSSKVKSVYFRDKSYGYASPNVKVILKNGKVIEQNTSVKSYAKIFFNGLSTRPSCYSCAFKTVGKAADFTLGDCWSIGKFNKEMDDNLGTTNVFVHTLKGLSTLKILERKMEFVEINTKKSIDIDGVKIINCAKPNTNRTAFFDDIDQLSYIELVNKYAPESIKGHIINIVKPLMKNSKLSEKIFRIVKQNKINKSRKNN
ncbi:MAG: Coenzyme F420 hydrogenase/dehydrogenase, beta subunit C-terminal domain [Aminipila sp.]